MNRRPQRQRGATLLVTLIMLVMLTLFALSAMNTATTNMRMVGNMQLRNEAMEATSSTIETTISTTQFLSTPANAIPNPCGGIPNLWCHDLNGDGTAELMTRLDPIPSCSQSRVIKIPELKIPNANAPDVACVQAQQQGTFAVAGAASTGDSLCSQTIWDVSAVTTPLGSSTSDADLRFASTQGIAVRIPTVDLATSCP